MTTEAVYNFAKAVQANEEMAHGLVTAVSQKQGSEAAEALAAYAREQGFAVTSQDAAALQGSAEGTLSDDELDGVAGGLSFQSILDLSFRDIVSGTGKLAGSLIGLENVAEKWRI